jgi:hypothetical protein
VVRLASVRALVSAGMGNLAVPPRPMFTQLGLAITEKPPFTLAAKFDAPFVQPGKAIAATITATRQSAFTGEITVTFQGLPKNVKVVPVKVPAMQTSTKMTLNLPPRMKLGAVLVTFVGTAKHNGRDFVVRSAPVQLLVKK